MMNFIFLIAYGTTLYSLTLSHNEVECLTPHCVHLLFKKKRSFKKSVGLQWGAAGGVDGFGKRKKEGKKKFNKNLKILKTKKAL